ncbi:MAG: UDP-N-acetylglucosamine 2-epimerase (non-hydrolyzing) [Gemmatimonadetes bacterium]|nr:UDP-N-acetylglucosamine 2-epimerase (non-hydrolyzing) [Gemmatimonadota bacterium]
MTVVHVVGARPNFMKMAPLLRALDRGQVVPGVLVHTGQHYDEGMSEAFFADLGIREPDFYLGVGSGSHAIQTAAVLTALEPILLEAHPHLVVVVGDVNSTLAAALAAAKLNIPVAHVEAGLRSHDRTMPEELNRLLTDQLSELLFTPSPDADENLLREGIPAERIHRVGNIMIDSLLDHLPRAHALGALDRLGLERGRYALVTLHRPSNVDVREQLVEIFEALDAIALQMPVVLPMHPRTRKNAEAFGVRLRRARALEPLGYVEMVSLLESAAVVLTDSGGIQEETTVLGVRCLTLRDTTERPITIVEGTNRLVPERTREAILAAVAEALSSPLNGRRPELWDGRTAGRIAEVIARWIGAR